MLSDYKYYSEEPSYLMNVFDFNTEYSNDHFLNLKILKYAEEHLANITPIGRGFIEINELFREAQNILVSLKAVEDSLIRLAKRNLIMLDTRSRESIDNAAYYRITECGSYFLNTLIKTFVYLDCVLMDSPIADIDVLNNLRQLLNETTLDMRFKRTKIFLDYLLRMEDKAASHHPEHKASPLGRFGFAKSMFSGFKKEREKIYKHY